MTFPASVDHLARATQLCGGIVAGVRPYQWVAPTPCSQWTVRNVVVHLILGMHLFADALEPDAPPTAAEMGASLESPEADLPAAFDIAGQLLVRAFSAPDALTRTMTVPFGTIPAPVGLHLRIVEMLVHGWDVAVATGAGVHFPEDLAEQEIGFSRQFIGRVPPGRKPFADPRPVAEDAPAIDRLVALLGRDIPAR